MDISERVDQLSKKVDDLLTPKRDLSDWTKTEWLNYYGQCREFLLALGQKFVSLINQVSVFAATACTALVTLRKVLPDSTTNIYFYLSIVFVFPILVYWYFLKGYFKQIREVGTIMGEMEGAQFKIDQNLQLLKRLREKAPIYGNRMTATFAYLYPWVLMIVVLATGLLLSFGFVAAEHPATQPGDGQIL